jgi:acetyltransferase
MDVYMEEDTVDCIFINFVTPFFMDNESIAKEIVEVGKLQEKPIVCNLMTDKRQWTDVVKILQEGGIPCFSLPSTAARTMTALVRYHRICSREVGEPVTFRDVDKSKARKIIDNTKTAGQHLLSSSDAYEILNAYGIPSAAWGMAGDADEAEKVAAEMGYPVVIKAEAESIVHKSDMGGVAVDLEDGNAVRSAIEDMRKRLDAKDLKFFVQKYLPDGLELILGAKSEEGLGHTIMFGLGGIFVEVMKDVVFNLTPVTTFEAKEMLASIKGAPLLKGVRGQKGVDEAKLIESIQRLSQLVTDLPEIQEMDLNPLIAYKDRIVVVDTRIGL